MKFYHYYIFSYKNNYIFLNGDWGLGIGDWGLGIGDWAQSQLPNPQSTEKIFTEIIKIFN